MKKQLCGITIVLGGALVCQPMAYAVNMNPMNMMKDMNPMTMMKDKQNCDDGYDRRYAPPRPDAYYPPRDYAPQSAAPRDDYYSRPGTMHQPYPSVMDSGAYPQQNYGAPLPRAYPGQMRSRPGQEIIPRQGGYAPRHPAFRQPPSAMPSLVSPLGIQPVQPPVRVDEWWK